MNSRAEVEAGVTLAVDEALHVHGEVGLQVCAVAAGGRVLVDVVGGHLARGGVEPVTSDTLFPVFSVTKGLVGALAIALLAEGVIELEAPVADLWPEFAAHGKAEVTVRQLLEHSAGVPQLPVPVTVEQLCDWESMTRRVADLTPRWRPGTAVGYHAYTWGWLVGELLRRAAGAEEFGALLRNRILADGARDFWVGTPSSERERIATVYRTWPADGAGLRGEAMPGHLATGQSVFGRDDVRRACLPAMGGIGSARAVATAYAALVDQSSARADRGTRPAWLDRTLASARTDRDVVLGAEISRALGFYASAGPVLRGAEPLTRARSIGHPGSGGSIAWADAEAQIGYAITRSRMTRRGWQDPVVTRLADAVSQAARRASVRPEPAIGGS